VIYRLPATYPAPPTRRAVDTRIDLAIPMKAGSRARVGWLGRAVKVTAAIFIEAVVILGFVMVSLGIGGEGNAGAGLDRPQLAVPSPMSAPDQTPTAP
jgi:hypothetical protein